MKASHGARPVLPEASPRLRPDLRERVDAWLNGPARDLPHIGALIEGLAALLAGGGLPLHRITTHIRTLHPSHRAVWRTWTPEDGLTERRPRHQDELGPAWHDSPVKLALLEGRGVDCPLFRGADPRFPIARDLLEQGFTHYVLHPLRFTDGVNHAISFATRKPGGLTAEDRAVLAHTARILAPLAEILALRRTNRELLETYVGPDTAALIRSGKVRLGEGRALSAAIWYSDLRDFSAISENETAADVVDMLNGYFEAVGRAAAKEGGEVVQFIGDATLIYFASGPERSARDASRAAQAAAISAIGVIREQSLARQAAGHCPTAVGIGLHYGDVIQVNVGGDGRQAVNIVGPAVNLTQRIEALTKVVGQPILMSAGLVGAGGIEARAAGTHKLHNMSQPVDVFTPG